MFIKKIRIPFYVVLCMLMFPNMSFASLSFLSGFEGELKNVDRNLMLDSSCRGNVYNHVHNGGPNQQWCFENVYGNVFRLKNKETNLYLYADKPNSGKWKNKYPVKASHRSLGDKGKWAVERMGGNVFRFRNVGMYYRLDAGGGEDVCAHLSNNGDYQKWYLGPEGYKLYADVYYFQFEGLKKILDCERSYIPKKELIGTYRNIGGLGVNDKGIGKPPWGKKKKKTLSRRLSFSITKDSETKLPGNVSVRTYLTLPPELASLLTGKKDTFKKTFYGWGNGFHKRSHTFPDLSDEKSAVFGNPYNTERTVSWSWENIKLKIPFTVKMNLSSYKNGYKKDNQFTRKLLSIYGYNKNCISFIKIKGFLKVDTARGLKLVSETDNIQKKRRRRRR